MTLVAWVQDLIHDQLLVKLPASSAQTRQNGDVDCVDSRGILVFSSLMAFIAARTKATLQAERAMLIGVSSALSASGKA